MGLTSGRSRPGWLLLEALGENLFCLSQLSEATLMPWGVAASLLPALVITSPS